jgi:galactose mutarotase-like enzyme
MQLYKAGQGQICLETQMMPDAINHSEFDQYGSTILRAGETFSSKTTYTFLAID